MIMRKFNEEMFGYLKFRSRLLIFNLNFIKIEVNVE